MNNNHQEGLNRKIFETETTRFKKFIENFKKKKVIEKKPSCRIFIFGSYNPPEAKQRLKTQQQFLRVDGYINTWLVENYPTYDDLSIREKSLYCLNFSHINFFIVTFEGEKGGFTVELEHIIKNAGSLSFKTIVFYEIRYQNDEKISSLSPLNEDGLISARIRMVEFEEGNDEELSKRLRAEAWKLQYHYVIYENRFRD